MPHRALRRCRVYGTGFHRCPIQFACAVISKASRRRKCLSKEGTMREVTEAALPDRMLVSAFMANVPDRVYFMDRESRLVSVSLSMAQFLGRDVDQVLGKTPFDFLDHAQAQAYRDRYSNVMRTGQAI